MSERKPLTISVDMNTEKLQLKLRAIAKHVESLADELDAIDNAWQCDRCGHDKYVVHDVRQVGDSIHTLCKCAKCKEKAVITTDEELPRPEGSA